MGWMEALETAKRMVAKKLGSEQEESSESVDMNQGPLGARIGGLVRLPIGDFALAGGSLVGLPPGAGSNREVVGIGRLKGPLLEGQKLYRVYVEDRDGPSGSEAFVQILLNSDGTPEEVAWFQTLHRFVPDGDAMEVFTGRRGDAGVGGLEFSVSADELMASSRVPKGAAEVLGDAGGISWARAISPEAAFVAPIEAVESQMDDPSGMRGLRRDAMFMIYGREVADGRVERLMTEWRRVTSRDGKEIEEFWVEILVGLPLDPSRVSFL